MSFVGRALNALIVAPWYLEVAQDAFGMAIARVDLVAPHLKFVF